MNIKFQNWEKPGMQYNFTPTEEQAPFLRKLLKVTSQEHDLVNDHVLIAGRDAFGNE